MPTRPLSLLALLLVSGALAQNRVQTPPPVAGKYGCVQFHTALAPQLRANPEGGESLEGSNAAGWNFRIAPQTQVAPSPLGTLVLDGKGNYRLEGGIRGAGRYTFDQKTRRPAFTGPLGQLGAPRYFVTWNGSSGTFSIQFATGGDSVSFCEVKVSSNPLPALKSPNGALGGVIALSNLNGTQDLRAADGRALNWWQAPLGVRDARGRFVYVRPTGSGQHELVVQDRAGKRLSGFGLSGYGVLDAERNHAALSPDGRRVALLLSCPPDQATSASAHCLAVTDLNGANTRILARTLNVRPGGGPPVWTPDGRLIYSGRNGRLYLADAGFRNERALTAHEGRAPALSPDGKRVAYLSGNALYVVNLDGSGARKIDGSAAPSPALISTAWAPDGRFLVTIARVESSAYLWVNPLSGKPGYTLTDAYGQAVDVYAAERLSWWAGK